MQRSSFKIGDVVVPTSPDLDKTPMIYMGIGLWNGWIRVYCPAAGQIIQVRKTFVKAVKKCP